MSKAVVAISDDLVVEVWGVDRDAAVEPPTLIQPFNPNGGEWESREQAQAWADEQAAAMEQAAAEAAILAEQAVDAEIVEEENA